MFTSTCSRRCAGVLVAAGVFLTQACYSYQRPKGSIPPGSQVRVKAEVPFLISETTPGRPDNCQATEVKGLVREAGGERIAFADFEKVVPAERSASECSSLSAGTVSLRADDEVRVWRFSILRNVLLLASIAGIVALGIGQADVGY